MSEFCTDRDLLSMEPVIFMSRAMPSQQIVSGSSAGISGTGFTYIAGGLSAASAGMVLCIYAAGGGEARAYEIISVNSDISLTISVLRAATSAPAIAPPASQQMDFHIQSFLPQITAVSAELSERLRRAAEVSGVQSADFADSSQLRLTAACGALAAVFVALAENGHAGDANWIKAQHYQQLYRQRLNQLRLVMDADGDGYAEQSRTFGNVCLRRD